MCHWWWKYCGNRSLTFSPIFRKSLYNLSTGFVQENGKRYGVYEPVHGSAPDIANKGIANPIAQILSLSMMFKYSLDLNEESNLVDKAIKKVLSKNLRTNDIANENSTIISTDAMGDAIIEELKNLFNY